MLIEGGDLKKCNRCNSNSSISINDLCHNCYRINTDISYNRDLKIEKVLKSKKIFWQFWKK